MNSNEYPKPVLVFQTDFTYREGAVCSMYGVVKSVDRALEIIDGTHEIPQYDIWSASYRLYQFLRFWPKGTIFVSVVDPGVGTPRRACAAKTADGYIVITPDNGTLTHIAERHGIAEIREIDERVNRLKSTLGTSVFHGRDLFAYCAARLAGGIIDFSQIGPEYPVEEIVLMPRARPEVRGDKIRGIIDITDPNFGNLWTNIPSELFQNAGFRFGETLTLSVKQGDKDIFAAKALFERSFGYVSKGHPIIYINELMNIGLALNQESMAEKHKISFGWEWQVEIGR